MSNREIKLSLTDQETEEVLIEGILNMRYAGIFPPPANQCTNPLIFEADYPRPGSTVEETVDTLAGLFSRPVSRNTGTIQIIRIATGEVMKSYDVATSIEIEFEPGDSRVVYFRNPGIAGNLGQNNVFGVSMPEAAFVDAASPVCVSPTVSVERWAFTAAAAPALTVNVQSGTESNTIVVNFNRVVTAQVGNAVDFAIRNQVDDSIVQSFNVEDAAVTVGKQGAAYEIEFAALPAGSYYFDSGNFDDVLGNTISIGDTALVWVVEPAPVSVLPTGWSHARIGTPGDIGLAAWPAIDQEGTLPGSGSEVWGTVDEFDFYYRSAVVATDNQIEVHLEQFSRSDGQSFPAFAKVGLMLRSTTASNSAAAVIAAVFNGPAGNYLEFAIRSADGNFFVHVATLPTQSLPRYFRLVRRQDEITAFYSSDGVAWSQLGGTAVVNSADMLGGVMVLSHDNAVEVLAGVDDWSISSSPALSMAASSTSPAQAATEQPIGTAARITYARTLSDGDAAARVIVLEDSVQVASYALTDAQLSRDGADLVINHPWQKEKGYEIQVSGDVVRDKYGTPNPAIILQFDTVDFVGPTAAFSRVINFLQVQFTNASQAGEGAIASYAWNFGDGNNSTDASPQHTYQNAGNYTVQLSVTDANGKTDSVTGQVQVSTAAPPVADFDVSGTGLVKQFTEMSQMGAGAISAYAWDFGDGNSSNQQNPEHTYTSAGTYTVELTVTDANGNSDTESIDLQVGSPTLGPSVVIQTPTGSGLTRTFTATVTPRGASIASYLWNFGDGKTSSEISPTHTFPTAGTYNVSLTVVDDNGNETQDFESVTL